MHRNFQLHIFPPITEPYLTCGVTIFTKELSREESEEFVRLAADLNCKITPDNLKWGSATVYTSLPEINQENFKFAWGYDHTINMLLNDDKLPQQNLRVIRSLSCSLVKIGTLPDIDNVERTLSGVRTYKGFEQSGLEYSVKK